MEKVIEIKNLTMDYLVGFWRKRPVRVLEDLSLSVNAGEVFGFLGHNGAGKTTTLKILMRIIYQTSGNAYILGKPINEVNMRQNIGFLPETPYFYDYLTGTELLEYFGKLCGLETTIRRKRIGEILDVVGLTETANRQLRHYSKGMLQRIGIAQAILHNPQVVFLDEPMSGLDPIGRREVRDIIVSLRDQGKTVFFSTHILSDVEVLCDRVAVLRNGKRVAYGRLDEIQGKTIPVLEVVTTVLQIETLEILKSQAINTKQTAGGVHFELKEEDLEKMLPLIHQGNGRVISVNPIRSALEDFFIR